MRNKKLFNRLMAIIMCSTLTVSTPIMTYATETENVEETLQTAEETQADENGFVIKGSVLTDYVGTAEHVVVPEGVTQIGVYAFKGCSGLKEVTIPDGVTRIEANAFEECTTLTKITIPDSVTIIGAYAFNGCSGLTEIAIPNGVTTLGRATFGGCTSLTKVTIPSSVTTFTDRVFIGCTSLTEITIPDSVKMIGDYTFSGCSQLKEITIPNTVTYIGDGAFYGCSGLTISGEKDSVAHQYAQENGIEFKVLGEENEDSEQSEFIIENGVLTDYVGTAEHVVVPEGVTEIAMYGFSGCQMVSVKLPKSLQKVDWYGFSGCANLTNVEFLSSSLNIEGMAFLGCRSLKSIELPNGLTTISTGTFAYCSSLENVVIPDSVVQIGRGAFSVCNSLGKIAIPDSVTTIDKTAFAEEWAYDAELPPEGQMDITICGTEGSYAQQYAETYGFDFEVIKEEFVVENGVLVSYNGDATEITIPSNVTAIGSFAFKNCKTRINEIIVPGTVKTIKKDAFSGGYVKKITLKEGVEVIEERGINNNALEQLTIPASVTNIGTGAISGNNAMTEIGPVFCVYVMKDSYADTSIKSSGKKLVVYEDGSVLRNDKVLVEYKGKNTKLVIPENVTMIDDRALEGCEHVTEVVFPTSITSIGISAFEDTTWLKNLKEKNDLVIVDGYLLDGKSAKGEVVIPESVKVIADDAFRGNNDITKVTIPNSVTKLDGIIFDDCKNLKEIVIPASVTDIWGSHIDGTLFYHELEDLIIYGEEGSEAQKFAEENDYTFKVLGEESETPEQPQTPIYTPEQFDKLLEENIKSDVVIEANDNITITFGKGTMKEVDGVTSYDFTATTTNDYKASKLPTSVKEGEFVLKISYNYSGKLPANASVKIFVGKEYNGKTLYYSLLKEDGTLTETQKAVVENGYMTVTQSHCSDWIITTTNPNPDSENDQNDGGQDNNNQNDNSDDNKDGSPDTGENNAWASGILLVMSVALLGIARKRKIS